MKEESTPIRVMPSFSTVALKTIEPALKKLPKLYSTDGKKMKKVKITFMIPGTNWIWRIVEGNQEDVDDWLFFCYCHSGLDEYCSEWGYVMLSQLIEAGAVPFVERNMAIDLDGNLYF